MREGQVKVVLFVAHCVPVGGGEPVHTASAGCWCHPTPSYEHLTVVHNARDCRERFERQGLVNPGRPWVLVMEERRR